MAGVLLIDNVSFSLLELQLDSLSDLETKLNKKNDPTLKTDLEALRGVIQLFKNWKEERNYDYYKVVLRLQMGEYQKTAHHIVRAKNIHDAGILALKNECHCNNAVYEDGIMHDCGGEMDYSVRSSHQIPWELIDSLRNNNLM